MHYVYVLESLKNKHRYIGIAENVERRLVLHNAGQVRSTKAYLPWRVAHITSFPSQKEAAAKEWELKRNAWKRKELFDNLFGPIV